MKVRIVELQIDDTAKIDRQESLLQRLYGWTHHARPIRQHSICLYAFSRLRREL